MERAGKVAVIGAGIAGLCAAVYALKSGYEVELLEQHDVPGGLATSWQRNGYTFENSLWWLLGSRRGGMLHAQWREVFDIDALTFVYPEEYIRVRTEGGDSVTIYTDVDRMETELLKRSPADASEIHRFASAVRRLAGVELPDAGENRPAALLRMLRSAPVLPALRWWSGLSVQEYGSRYHDPLLKYFFGGEEPAHLSALALVFAQAWMSDRNAGYPIGGSRAVTDPIVAEFERFGGKLRCSSPVEKILVERDRATGVQLESGQTIAADWVVSAADGHETIYEFLGGRYTDEHIDRRYETREIFPSYVQVSLGVARDLSQYGGATIWVPDSPLQVDPGTVISRLTARFFINDPGFAPPGKTAVTCVLPTRNFAYWTDLQQRSMAGYLAEKDRVAQAVVASLDKLIPGLREAIEVTDVSTPASVIRFTRNWKGSYEGWLPAPGTSMMMPNTLPRLRRFLMAGQWAAPGGGFPSGLLSGRRAVRDICRHDGVPFLRRTVTA